MALSITEMRAALKAMCEAAFGSGYTVFDSRFRFTSSDDFPTVRVGVSGGREDDMTETINAVVVIAHAASGADFDGDTDLLVQNRVDDDLATLRDELNQSDVIADFGTMTGLSWDYSTDHESGKLVAWVTVTANFDRYVEYTDNADIDDLDSVWSETTIGAASSQVDAELLEE